MVMWTSSVESWYEDIHVLVLDWVFLYVPKIGAAWVKRVLRA